VGEWGERGELEGLGTKMLGRLRRVQVRIFFTTQ
jgi:hypothetical protein